MQNNRVNQIQQVGQASQGLSGLGFSASQGFRERKPFEHSGLRAPQPQTLNLKSLKPRRPLPLSGDDLSEASASVSALNPKP